MFKNRTKDSIQINRLYLSTMIEGLSLGSASWVALLALRGFSLSQIGIIEAIFHIVSLCGEIPSGAVADVLGRKKTMVASRVMSVLSALVMIVSNSFITVAIAIGVSALSYNLASGTREALAYDSLKYFGRESEYNRFASNDMVLYRICSGTSTLMAGLALYVGYKKAYSVDVVIGIVAIVLSLIIVDYSVVKRDKNGGLTEIKNCIVQSFMFLKYNPKVIRLITINSLVGAIATLMLFFLQAKLPELGLPNVLLGPSLFIMTLGAALGAKLVQYFDKVRFKKIICISCLGVMFAFSTLFFHNPYLIVLGGIIAAFSDDFMQVRADVVLNDMIPSEQRATLGSVNSFSFSVIMIVLSPIIGKVLEMI